MTVLVVDAGTSGIRALALDADGGIRAERHLALPPSTPHPGMVEVDAAALATAAVDLARRVVDEVGPVDGVGIAAQRATTIAWDARTGAPVAPGIGWQDLRTVGRCLELRAEGTRVAPNQTATKAEWLVRAATEAGTDPDDLRIGTVDAWLAWALSGGALHVTDATNAQVTGLTDTGARVWDPELCDLLGIPVGALPRIVDTSGIVGAAVALPGAPPIAALVGDQQSSLVGQACTAPGDAKVTLGTGAMLDQCLGPEPGPDPGHGTFPILGWRIGGADTWAREAIALTAGTCVDWLVDGLGLVATAAETATVAAEVPDTDGVVFVPALSGLGTPVWDHGARGTLVGLTRGSTRAHVVRAVLEGIAHRVADLVDAVEADAGRPIARLRADGGMTANAVLVDAVAAATGRPVEVAAVGEATALGAGHLAGVAVGTWPDLGAAAATAPSTRTVESDHRLDRDRWAGAVERARNQIPALSDLDL